jgi:predicted GIY-YIG superfamily endonuclease
MPRTPINYQNTVIYKIVCNDLNIKDLYVGHTTDFTKRKCCHKTRCGNINGKHYNYKVYDYIRKILR